MTDNLRRLAGAFLAVCLTAGPLAGQAWTSGRPDGHAPIGVMGDHVHSGGEMMLSYRFMRMAMEGNRTGTEAVPTEAVLDDYMVAPLRMPMSMHMFGAMVAPADVLTLMLMVPVVRAEMDHRTRMGGTFTAEAAGVGDVKLSGLVRLFSRDRRTAHLDLGLSAPTGSIEEADVTPARAPNEAILPYPMQIGSGTWDLRAGATFLGQSDRTSWGLQARGTVRPGENDRGYRQGHRGLGTAWGALLLNDWLSVSARLEGAAWGDVEGADAALNPMMVPTADPVLRGGKRADLGIGLTSRSPRVRSTGSAWPWR